MKTVAPLSTVRVPRSPERVLDVARRTTVRGECVIDVVGDGGEVVRVARGAVCDRRLVLRVPRGVEAVVTLEVIVERDACFSGEVVLEGEGVCTVRRILRVVGSRANVTWTLRGSGRGTSRFFEESWMLIRGSQQRLGLRTRFVLVDGAFFTGRHFVAATALGASGTAESSLDVLRATEGVVATVVPEVGAMPVGLTVQHGARVLGVAEAQQEYLQAHGVLPSVARQTLIDAFFYA